VDKKDKNDLSDNPEVKNANTNDGEINLCDIIDLLEGL